MERFSCRNWWAIVPAVAGIFFPLREPLGFDAREFSPGMVVRITFAAADTRSFERARLMLAKVGDAKVSTRVRPRPFPRKAVRSLKRQFVR